MFEKFSYAGRLEIANARKAKNIKGCMGDRLPRRMTIHSMDFTFSLLAPWPSTHTQYTRTHTRGMLLHTYPVLSPGCFEGGYSELQCACPCQQFVTASKPASLLLLHDLLSVSCFKSSNLTKWLGTDFCFHLRCYCVIRLERALRSGL